MTLATIKQDILKQYKNLVSKAILKAIDIIFSPCCEEDITVVAYDCATNDLTVTISPAIPSVGLNGGFAKVFVGAAPATFLGTGTISADGTSIVIAGVAEMDVVGETIFTADLFLPTGLDDENNGAYIHAAGTVTAIPAC